MPGRTKKKITIDQEKELLEAANQHEFQQVAGYKKFPSAGNNNLFFLYFSYFSFAMPLQPNNDTSFSSFERNRWSQLPAPFCMRDDTTASRQTKSYGCFVCVASFVCGGCTRKSCRTTFSRGIVRLDDENGNEKAHSSAQTLGRPPSQGSTQKKKHNFSAWKVQKTLLPRTN